MSAQPPLPLPQAEEAPVILIADDDPTMRLMMRHTLERDGYRVEEAVNGLAAIAAFERLRPDITLMDAVMPEMDGFTACATIRELSGHRALVLIITALNDDASAQYAFSSGAWDYLTKPIHWGVLLHRLRHMLNTARSERRLHQLAFQDTITGLPNRASLNERLERLLAEARLKPHLHAVLFVDLDRFKLINDTLGHDQGDRLLREVAQRLRGCVRDADTIARLGGDEFVILLEGLRAPEDAGVVARKVLDRLHQPITLHNQEIVPSASIGIALHPADGRDLSELVKHADTAMYRAKERGRARYEFYHPEMGMQVSRRLDLENALRQGIARHEFTLHYQPQVDIGSGRPIGLEALVRWRRPDEGLVAPLEFIPLAEETGLIVPLGEEVLRLACQQLRAWDDQGFHTPRMAINLSARQIYHAGFVARTAAILQEWGIDGRRIEFEITESCLMEQPEEANAVLHDLKALGAGLSIDDFGTGYSSLSYLKRFPIDTLKIDRSFVRDVPRDSDDAAIVSAVIALAHSLQLNVVAEGVETSAQAQFLAGRGCTHAQGYLYSPPHEARVLEEWLRNAPSRTPPA